MNAVEVIGGILAPAFDEVSAVVGAELRCGSLSRAFVVLDNVGSRLADGWVVPDPGPVLRLSV